MDFFKYDFKHTCFRLIISLIIGSIWIWFMSKLETNYRNDTTDFLLLSNILVIIIYPIFEIILFGYRNFRNQQNFRGYLKVLSDIIILTLTIFFTVLFILIACLIICDPFKGGFHG